MHVSSLNESAAAGVLSLASCPDALSQGKPSEHVYEPSEHVYPSHDILVL